MTEFKEAKITCDVACATCNYVSTWVVIFCFFLFSKGEVGIKLLSKDENIF